MSNVEQAVEEAGGVDLNTPKISQRDMAMAEKSMRVQRANFVKKMKDDVEILKLDSDYWEYKFKAMHYKHEYARMEAMIAQEMADAEAFEQKMKEQVLENQGPLPSENPNAEPIPVN